MTDSDISSSGITGIRILNGGNTPYVDVKNSSLAFDPTAISVGNGVVVLAGSKLFGNTTGVDLTGGGTADTALNNDFSHNNADVSAGGSLTTLSLK